MFPGKPLSCFGCVYMDCEGFNVGHMGRRPGEQPAGEVKLFFVGEGLGETEVSSKFNFAGGSGRVLDYMLEDSNISRNESYFSNVVRCRPPNNEDPNPLAVSRCRHFLEEELARIKPNLIVALGNYPLAWLTGQQGIAKRRGSVFQTPYGKVMAMVHPAAIMRQRDLLRPVTLWDLKRAKVLSQDSNPLPPDEFEVWPSVEQIEEVCNEAKIRGRITLDIETAYGDGLVRLGIGWRDRAISIPLVHGGGDASRYYSSEQESQIVSVVDDLLRDPGIVKRGHNSTAYDTFRLTDTGFTVNNQDDTIIMHHCLYPELEHKLEKVASSQTDEPYHYYKDEAKGRGEMVVQEPTRVGIYNCKDVKVTDMIADDMLLRLKGMGLYDLYREIALPIQEIACTALRRRGVYVDVSILDEQSQILLAEAEELEKLIQDITWPGFNPGTNSNDLPQLIHGVWKYPVLAYTEKTRKPKADEDTFLKIQEMAKPEHGAVLELILEYRQTRKLYSSWIEDFYPSHDGRLHPEWLGWRTRSGRLASYPNVQNLPTGDGGKARRVFTVSCPGNRLLLFDQKQAELRYIAILSQDEPLLTVFAKYDEICKEIRDHERQGKSIPQSLSEAKRDWDPHYRNASDMWQLHPRDITKEMRFRGKIFVFGLIYGGTPESVLAHGGRGLTRTTANLDLLKGMSVNWWAKHPSIRAFLDGVAADVRNKRVLRDPNGWFRQFYGPIKAAIREGWDYYPQRGIAHLMNRMHIPFEKWCQENLKTPDLEFGSWGPVLQIHDALINEIPEDRVEEAWAEAERLIERPWTYKGKDYIFPADHMVGTRFSELR